MLTHRNPVGTGDQASGYGPGLPGARPGDLHRVPPVLGPVIAGLLLAALALGLAGCFLQKPPQGLTVAADGRSFSYQQEGRKRSGGLFVPPEYDGTADYSLVIAFHGANGTGEDFRQRGFDRLAGPLRWIVAYPDGLGGRWESAGEVPFVTDLIDQLSKKYRIDPRRVYLTGHSAGAIHCYELARVLSPRIAAIAPVAGLVQTPPEAGQVKPVSILHLHARDDRTVPWDGVLEYGFLSVTSGLEAWKRVNGAGGQAAVFRDDPGIKGSLWKGPQADTALLDYRSGGHGWLPGATEAIADFFYNHPARANSLRLRADLIPVLIPEYAPFTLRTSLADPGGVQKVEFFSNGQSLGESSQPPFSLLWENPARGRHSLSALATLKDGGTVASTLNPTILAVGGTVGGAAGNTVAPPLPAAAVSASSVQADEYPAAAAVDGNMLTRWSSAWADNQDLTVDLGYVRQVSAVSLFWEVAYAASYVIAVSSDGTAWRTVAERADCAGNEEYLAFPACPARYVRLTGKTRATEWGFSLWEFMVHGE